MRRGEACRLVVTWGVPGIRARGSKVTNPTMSLVKVLVVVGMVVIRGTVSRVCAGAIHWHGCGEVQRWKELAERKFSLQKDDQARWFCSQGVVNTRVH